MKKTKQLVVTQIIAIVASIVMLATFSFAWFFASKSANVSQIINIGKFEVNLVDGADAVPPQSSAVINITDMYPMTRDTAVNKINDKTLSIYTFEIVNAGDVPVQFRLSAQVQSDTAYTRTSGVETGAIKPLSKQIRYVARGYMGEVANASWDGGGFLFGDKTVIGAEVANISLKQYFNTKLLNANTAKTEYTSKKELLANSKVKFDLAVWLDENATLESVGQIPALTPKVSPKLEFYIRLDALQFGGGASWAAADVADKLSESIPPIKPGV